MKMGAMHSRPEPPAKLELDQTSKHLVALLQKDGRMTYAALGQAVGLSETAVRQRVQRLIDSKTIQVVAVTDPMQLGFSRQAMVGIKTSTDPRVIADVLVHIPGVEYLVNTTGRYDLLAEVVTTSDQELMRIVSADISGVPGVESTEAFVYLRLEKQTYAWGVL